MVAAYNATTVAIQQIMQNAVQQNMQIRALGGGWSFTRVAATNGWMLNTKLLNMIFTINDQQNISAQYSGDRQQLLFVQCGNSIQELNSYLASVNKSLKTSGASNGQTIAGAVSTGTHGSAFDFGATQEFVVGIHIITGPNSHVWLERASYPVVSDAFIQKFQTELVSDDDLFNAALVSFGSFGFIHGLMIETEPVYLLECYRLRIPIDQSLKFTMQSLDFTNANFLPHQSERPFHFQSVINQYDMQNGAYVMVMYKRPYTSNYNKTVLIDPNKAGPGDDVPAFLGKLTDFVPGLTHVAVNNLIKTAYAPYSNILGTSGEIFTNNDIRGKVLSTAIGIPLDFVNEVNDLLIQLNETSGPFSGVFSYRYVKRSNATLAFTNFPETCIVELDGVQSAITQNFYEVVWSELGNRNIPYTFHWGKINNLDRQKIIQMYGNGRDSWISARNQLLDADSIKLFNNEALVNCGLDGL